tara:strand:- start:179 stop:586 length:408 start_codon:yes stop_codon:yes gene_type:complete
MIDNKFIPDTDIDPTDVLQGHNGQVQRFSLLREQKLLNPRNKRVCREFLITDQFENIYLVYRAVLQDGETYDVGDWVKDSVLLHFGGFTNDCIDAFRAKAFTAFVEASQDIEKIRALANEVAGKMISMPVNFGGN